MSKFYTSVNACRDDLFVRGYIDGKAVKQQIEYKPYLFTSATEAECDGFHTIQGKPVKKVQLESMTGAKDFQEDSKEVGRKLYGLNKWEYVYINDMFPGEIQYDASLVSVVGIDIETDSDDGFGTVEEADKEIWTITLRKNGRILTLGYHDYTPHRDNVEYIKCPNEEELLKEFLLKWNSPEWMPDIVTGWYIEFYDIPYLINRIRKVLGPKASALLSPFRRFDNRRFNRVINGQVTQYEEEVPLGIAILDYMGLYKKFSFVMQESYKLDHIAYVVLGKRKLDYSSLGYESLSELYHGNFQKFVEYNIIDIDLVAEMDDKLKLIEQVMAIAYDAKVNFIDALTTVNLWDIMIHNYLMEQKHVVPFYNNTHKSRDNIGGYVKTPKSGMHKWIVSFDLTSLYPHLIMQYNISPDTLVEVLPQYHAYNTETFENGVAVEIQDNAMDKFLEGDVDKVREKLLSDDVTICPSGCLFTRKYQGFLAALMEKIFSDRVVWKKRMLEAKQKYEDAPTPELEKEIARCWSMQQAKKIEMNSGYGALANEYFRWFDIRLAESVTSAGQFAIRWAERHINLYLNKIMETKNVDYVIAIDTDSLYLSFDPIVQKFYPGKTDEQTVAWIDKMCEKTIQPQIDKIYDKLGIYVNAYQQKMKMKREAIANKGIWTAKKHYVLNVWDLEGVRYKTPQLKLQGIEAVRSSTPMSCRDAIKEALFIILNGTEKDLQTYIANFRSKFFKMSFEEVAFPRGVKGIKEYALIQGKLLQKGTPIHVKAALFYNMMIQKHKLENKYNLITSGDKIKFSYMLESMPLPVNVFGSPGKLPKEFELDMYIDYNMQFTKAFLDPLRSITDIIAWQLERQSSLEDFF